MRLTEQQKEIVNYNQLGILVVKGTAGSGKSLVGLHRINYLFDRKNSSLFSESKKCKVLVITFNKVMFHQLEKNFKEIKNENINSDDVKFINIDKIMYEEAKRYIKYYNKEHKKNFEIIWESNLIKIIINKLNFQKNKYSNEFVLDEIDWIRKNLINGKQKYLGIIRTGRGKRRLNKEDREYIWNILQNYREELKLRNKIDKLDAYILALRESNLNLFSEYNHIIVDEAQDLNKLKLSFIAKLNQNNLSKTENSLTILYDISQNVYDDSWLGCGNSFSDVGLEVRNKVKKLEVSYRTTRQIHQAANNLISIYKEQNIDKEMELKPSFAGTEEGIKPIVFNFKNREDEYETYSDIIKRLTQKAYSYKDIIVVSFTNKGLHEIENIFNKNKIPCYILDGNIVKEKEKTITLNDNKIRLMTINNAKGLESKIVFVVNTGALTFISASEEKNKEEMHVRNTKKLYTAMTRAQELLFLSEDNEYVCKIDEKYLTKISNHQNLDIDSYISSELQENNILIETNKTERFDKIISEYKKQAEEQENIRMMNEIQLQKELYKKSEETEENKVEIKFKELDREIRKLISEAELLYNLFKKQSISSSLVYIAYAKILEDMMRNFIKDLKQGYSTKITFGTLVGHARKFKLLKPICFEIDSLKIISNRNDAAHSVLKKQNEVERIRNFLIEEEGILKIKRAIDEQLKISLNLPEEIIKEGNLMGNYSIVRVNKKEYYSYLINDDELAVCKVKIKLGRYKLKGHYTNSRGMKIYVIDKYVMI